MEKELVTPGEVMGKASSMKAGRGVYVAAHNNTLYASLTGRPSIIPPSPDSVDQRPTVEVTGHKAHGAVPEPGSVVIARVTKVMARMASADIMCVGPKSVREKFTGTIRQQDVRATEIDKVDMHSSFRPGDIVRALVLSLGDARAYYLTTAKNELGVVSAESVAGAHPKRKRPSKNRRMPLFATSTRYSLVKGKRIVRFVLTAWLRATMVPVSWTEMQCPLTGQIEQRKVAKVA